MAHSKLPLPDGWLIARQNDGRHVVLQQARDAMPTSATLIRHNVGYSVQQSFAGWADLYRVARVKPFANRFQAITWIYRVVAKEEPTRDTTRDR